MISGIMHKGVDLPFEMTSELSLEPDGRIRSHPQKMKMLGVDGTALLHALGMHLEKVLGRERLARRDGAGDDLLLDPGEDHPAARDRGPASLPCASMAITSRRRSFARPTIRRSARGRRSTDTRRTTTCISAAGQLRFGKLLMTDTDLLIVDADQRDPFDLYMARYNIQLTAGTTKNLPNLGLRVAMPDYGKVSGKEKVGGLAGQAGR